MTRPQHMSTFRIPRVPLGLVVILGALALIAALILLDHAMGIGESRPAITVGGGVQSTP
ncbi:hypothetical protein [Nocardia seriolae]|uniref:Uncharacterized protein n=1 Tax=Nocardia seriolae TaxID=37332 RepID=A0A0B8N9Y7_9NOCA|nr:hypothetical protein [Nocardia seriolae]APA95061.1 hypothetical protein NS506_00987 [Nocardia seriolae]MTJ66839.1 hypothetical protein [Nocardia seriolae]MTJ70362.1 hypothetical protein [Nocardia seriolae]MTJ85325.1 hypothetical protein [Nocardia seriolae]MTK29321.1 hypothetical protein [Nocardia seriolae]